MTTSTRLLVFLGLTVLSAWPSPSSAQPTPPASSASPQSAEEKTATEVRALFQEGLGHQKAGRWAEAERAYLAAWQKKKTHDIAANLALVSVELKKHLQAAEYFAFALRNYPAGGSPGKRADMEVAFKESKSQVGTLRITVNVEDGRISVNGVDRGKSPLEEEVFVAPGPYVVSVRRERYVPAEQKGTIEKGAAAAVNVVLEPEKIGPVPTATATTTAPPPPPPKPSWAILGAGAGLTVASGAVAIGLSAAAKGAQNEVEQKRATLSGPCPKEPTSGVCKEIADAAGRHDTLVPAAIGLFVTAGLAGAGTLVYGLWPRTAPVTPAVAAGPDGAAFSLSGRF